MADTLPKIGSRVRVWYGSGFARTGVVLQRDEQDREVFVKFDYPVPNEWVREDQLS